MSKPARACLATASAVNAAIDPPLTSKPIDVAGEAEARSGEPSHDLPLHVDRGVVSPAQLGVHRGGERVGEDGERIEERRVHPAVEARVAVAEQGRGPTVRTNSSRMANGLSPDSGQGAVANDEASDGGNGEKTGRRGRLGEVLRDPIDDPGADAPHVRLGPRAISEHALPPLPVLSRLPSRRSPFAASRARDLRPRRRARERATTTSSKQRPGAVSSSAGTVTRTHDRPSPRRRAKVGNRPHGLTDRDPYDPSRLPIPRRHRTLFDPGLPALRGRNAGPLVYGDHGMRGMQRSLRGRPAPRAEPKPELHPAERSDSGVGARRLRVTFRCRAKNRRSCATRSLAIQPPPAR